MFNEMSEDIGDVVRSPRRVDVACESMLLLLLPALMQDVFQVVRSRHTINKVSE